MNAIIHHQRKIKGYTNQRLKFLC